MSIAEQVTQLKADIDAVYEAGKNANPFYYASTLTNAFRAVEFPESYDFVVRLKTASANSQYIFYNATNIKSAKLIADDKSVAVSLSYAFDNVLSLETVDLTEYSTKLSDGQYMCFKAIGLKSIYGAFDLTECTGMFQAFHTCTSLEDIEFVPGTIGVNLSFAWSDRLSRASILSVLDGLSDDVSGFTLTLSLDAVNAAFETSRGAGNGADSDEWSALAGSHANWTIALS